MAKDLELGLESPTTVSYSTSSNHHHHVDQRWWLQALPFVVLISILLVTLLPVLHHNQHITDYTLLYEDANTSDSLSIALILSGVNTDTNQLSALLMFQTLPAALTVASAPQLLSKTLNLIVGGNSITLTPTNTNLQAAIPQQFTIASGSLSMYPFDQYTVPLMVKATATSGTTSNNIPVHLSVYTTTDFNWVYDVKSDDSTPMFGPVATNAQGQINIQASRHTIFFSYIVLLWLGTWVIGITLLYTGSMTIIWERKGAEVPIYFSGLIVIPIFRNTAPGRVPYGCLFDMTSTYLALALSILGMIFATYSSFKAKKTI
ncbi:hypothetical protein THRCLA_01367 [Thraustotheca clavata]|uniref:Transmembrane protein n=1 Tax=Thraustotheca clavata TaxID=74557 RepID=A0A1W0A8H5_9STRA|nr:hypothetical protein THRCLA_01367 [Thraustotheca clavata]